MTPPAKTIARAMPYKGLVPYTEEDSALFFGREAEQDVIAANLIASRFTLLYGTSGVGKTSLLRAGVISRLRVAAAQELTSFGAADAIPVYFSAWRDNPITAFADEIRRSVRDILGDEIVLPELLPSGLVEWLRAVTEAIQCDVLVVLDQFEEYFLYHKRDGGQEPFAQQFVAAVNDPTLHVNFLLAIRDDAVTQLDVFKGRIPNLFDNYLRVEHLSQDAARRAIEGPLEEYNRERPSDDERVAIEPELVSAVLSQLRTGAVSLAGVEARGAAQGVAASDTIETPYLQLVLTRLWSEETRAGSRVLRRATLERLGGCARIVRTHLDRVMRSLPRVARKNSARMFKYLVTPSGSKVAYAPRDLAYFTGMSTPGVEAVARELAATSRRILRPVQSQSGEVLYEIFHDVLGAGVLDWRQRYLSRRRWARWAFWTVLVMSLVALVAYFNGEQSADENLIGELESKDRALAAAVAALGGVSPSDQVVIHSGSMGAEREETWPLRLVGGRQYAIAATCDKDCSHLLLQADLPQGAEATRVDTTHAAPSMLVRAPRSGHYKLKLGMNACSTAPCVYSVVILGSQRSEMPKR